MKTSLFAFALSLCCAAPLCADDHSRGLKLLAEGKFAEAAAAFRAAAATDPTDPRVHYNLALALWRAGEASEAEIAAEKAATLSDGKLVPLRDGIFGNLKMSEAQGKLAGEQPDLQAALGAAQKARDHFLHGAVEAGAPSRPRASAELTRNLERALQLIEEIEKKIEEQKEQEKKDDEQKKDDKGEPKDGDEKDDKKDESKDGEKKPDDKKPDEKPAEKPDDEKKDEQKQDEKDQNKSDEQKEQDQKQQGKPEDKPPEPKPEQQPDPKSEQGAPEAKPGDDKEQKPQPKPEPKPGAEEQEPPPQGEQKDAQAGPPPEQRELSPEETKRLLDLLAKLQAQQVELEKARAAARPKVKKDW